jgi:hypothetical protein
VAVLAAGLAVVLAVVLAVAVLAVAVLVVVVVVGDKMISPINADGRLNSQPAVLLRSKDEVLLH